MFSITLLMLSRLGIIAVVARAEILQNDTLCTLYCCILAYSHCPQVAYPKALEIMGTGQASFLVGFSWILLARDSSGLVWYSILF